MNTPFSLRRASLAALCLCATLFFVGCDSDDPEGVTADVKVMSYNLYLGAEIFDLVGIPAEQVPLVAAQLFADVQATDFPARAEAIADIIEAEGPALIGLQEVTLYRTQTPADNLPGGDATPATDIAFDFLEILQTALDARGLDYVVAATTTNADVEIPSTADGVTFTDIRLTDRDVILARAGVGIDNVVEANFSMDVTAPVPVGDQTVPFTRGYNSVRATVDDVSFTFANAHLEVEVQLPPGAEGQPQEGQALELNAALRQAATPIVLVGDFNSPADGSGTRSYSLLTTAYSDAFVAAGVEGNTCCQDADLLNTTPDLTSRIDLILYRGGAEALSVDIVGDEAGDRTEAGLWPSDHAGVVATLRIEN